MSGHDGVPPDAPLAAFVEGLLDGRVADTATLLAAVRELGSAGAGEFRCDVHGGRFSLLPVDTRVAAHFDAAAQARFLEALRAVVAAALPGSVEGNLRCRLLYPDVVAETLFVVQGARIEPLTRTRPRTAADDAVLAPVAPALPGGLRRRELLWLGPALLGLGGLLAWYGGWIDRALAARAEGLRLEPGPFGAMLGLSVQRTWGNYRVELRRGPDYPATPAALADRLAAAGDHTLHAAVDLVGDGRDLYVQLLDDAGVVLAEVLAELRPLLSDADATVMANVPGRMHAAAVRLSVTAAPRPR